ncbi:hypothetical protein [Thiospirillum jenense]|uniref:Uncharacterized protein n=1 Tax=Thiospirillum jenense TaxID=1653858 RepID=A0A839HD82_9GAMM|nr:hypothetical protein [Thiospirillum jenense]MBB1125147.1 hypothetical protein [Thiospirillum jenense]
MQNFTPFTAFQTLTTTNPAPLRHGLSLPCPSKPLPPAWTETERAVNRHPDIVAIRREVLSTLEEVLAIFDEELAGGHSGTLQS